MTGGEIIMKPLEIKGARVRLGYKQQFMADSFGISLPSYDGIHPIAKAGTD